MILFLSYLVKSGVYRVCYMQISYEMVSNAHVQQLTLIVRERYSIKISLDTVN